MAHYLLRSFLFTKFLVVFLNHQVLVVVFPETVVVLSTLEVLTHHALLFLLFSEILQLLHGNSTDTSDGVESILTLYAQQA